MSSPGEKQAGFREGTVSHFLKNIFLLLRISSEVSVNNKHLNSVKYMP